MFLQKSFDKLRKTGTLALVPTPIGNLEDMTYRSVQVLRDVDVILSEDTRNTQKLLNHFEIPTKQMSFHEHNVQSRIPEILEKMKQGVSFAQVSDAGMPSISDPGKELVEACIAENLSVYSLPGATAGVTALVSSGLSPQPFTFIGFLPRKKKEQVEFFEKIKKDIPTQIFYESPFRVKKTLQNMQEVFGDRKVVLARELTKIHEEYRRGTLSEVIESLDVFEVKGEIVLLLEGATKQLENEEEKGWETLTILEHVALVEKDGISQKEAIKKVAKLRGLKKQEVYMKVHGDENKIS